MQIRIRNTSISPNVVIFDSATIERRGLETLLRQRAIQISGYSNPAEELLAFAQRLGDSWNFLIADLAATPGPNLRALRVLRSRFPEKRILVFSQQRDPAVVLEAIRSGVDGYVTKISDEPELLRAIDSISEGRCFFSSDLASIVSANEDGVDPNFKTHRNLSKREYEVLILLGQGRSNARIARELGIGAKTVSSFRSRILEKLGLANNAQMVQYCLSHNLLPQGSSQEHASEHENHLLQFYHSSRYLGAALAEYVKVGFDNGETVVVLAKRENREAMLEALTRNYPEEIKNLDERLLVLDAEQIVTEVTASGAVDGEFFVTMIRNLIRTAKGGRSSARFYGELVQILVDRGRPGDALVLEKHWNEVLAESPGVVLMCGYHEARLREAAGEDFPEFCNSHRALIESMQIPSVSDSDPLYSKLGQMAFRASQGRGN